MRVKCVINQLAAISAADVRSRLGRSIHIEGPISGLSVGQEYLVQALEHRDDGIWLYLHTFEDSSFPHPYPAEMFEWQDRSIPDGWCLGVKRPKGNVVCNWISFPEWASDDRFYEKLVGGDSKTTSIYASRRR